MFLKYLRRLYNRDSGVAITIRNGKGGSPRDVLMCAVNEIGAFDKRVVVVDNDKGGGEMTDARNEAKNRGIEWIENSPCLEALLLSILQEGESFSNKDSRFCKKEFQSNYIEKKKRKKVIKYEKVFPKKILDKMQGKISNLEKLVNFMKGK